MKEGVDADTRKYVAIVLQNWNIEENAELNEHTCRYGISQNC